MTALADLSFEAFSPSDFCHIGPSCNMRNCPWLFRREGSYDRYLRVDDYCRRKDDSYFDRYRDSFDGRGPPGPESQSRAKGEAASVCSHYWRGKSPKICGHQHLYTKGSVIQPGSPQMLMLIFKCKLALSCSLIILQEMRNCNVDKWGEGCRWRGWDFLALSLFCR